MNIYCVFQKEKIATKKPGGGCNIRTYKTVLVFHS